MHWDCLAVSFAAASVSNADLKESKSEFGADTFSSHEISSSSSFLRHGVHGASLTVVGTSLMIV